jgi:hypothetical protein
VTAPTIPAEYLAELIAEAEREVTFTQATYDGLRDGTRHWKQEYPGMFTCHPNPPLAAEEQAATELDIARENLRALTGQANGAAMERQGGD